jgi:hypothetical protein
LGLLKAVVLGQPLGVGEVNVLRSEKESQRRQHEAREKKDRVFLFKKRKAKAGTDCHANLSDRSLKSYSSYLHIT